MSFRHALAALLVMLIALGPVAHGHAVPADAYMTGHGHSHDDGDGSERTASSSGDHVHDAWRPQPVPVLLSPVFFERRPDRADAGALSRIPGQPERPPRRA